MTVAPLINVPLLVLSMDKLACNGLKAVLVVAVLLLVFASLPPEIVAVLLAGPGSAPATAETLIVATGLALAPAASDADEAQLTVTVPLVIGKPLAGVHDQPLAGVIDWILNRLALIVSLTVTAPVLAVLPGLFADNWNANGVITLLLDGAALLTVRSGFCTQKPLK